MDLEGQPVEGLALEPADGETQAAIHTGAAPKTESRSTSQRCQIPLVGHKEEFIYMKESERREVRASTIVDGLTDCRAVVADVRGTLLHPIVDMPISRRLADTLGSLLTSGCRIALNTAGSIDGTLEPLFLPRLYTSLKRLGQPLAIQGLTIYADSGTRAFAHLTQGSIVPLADYAPLTFQDLELHILMSALDTITSGLHTRRVQIKMKAGQVNYYCGGGWPERLHIAAELRQMLSGDAASRLRVMVPSAKRTIDIALCMKDRPVHDFIHRYNIPDSRLLLLGDSFQQGGADLDMVMAAPRACAVHVGSLAAASPIVNVGRGVQGARKTLCTLLRSRER